MNITEDYYWLQFGFISYNNFEEEGKLIHPSNEAIKHDTIHLLREDFYKKTQFGTKAHYFASNYWVPQRLFDKINNTLNEIGISVLTEDICIIIAGLDYSLNSRNTHESEEIFQHYLTGWIESHDFHVYVDKILSSELELKEIIFKANRKGQPNDFTIRTEYLLNGILKIISQSIKYNTEKDISALKRPTPYKHGFMNDLNKQLTAGSLIDHINAHYPSFKLYKKYYIIGLIYSCIGILDEEDTFLSKNGNEYSYTSYYKYLTDNIRNIVRRPVPLTKKTDRRR